MPIVAARLSAASSMLMATEGVHAWGSTNKQILEQDKITDARVEAERALAKALQQHAEGAGLAAWEGQVIGTSGATWFGGLVLSTAMNTTDVASMDVQEMEPGLDRLVVCLNAIWSSLHIVESLACNCLT
jgi:hypothetical protein